MPVLIVELLLAALTAIGRVKLAILLISVLVWSFRHIRETIRR